ncbi:hypothetical protein BRD00_04295 [Halobacteriales archaeon QS_8_69_26]|nr:MAG: hypothetical protein BRD00_04295 [Halobacteriales archaeon QS_8_69_26]
MIELPRECRDEVVAQAREAAPREACGLLGGTFGDDHSRVESVHRAENVAAAPRSEYEADPEEAYRVLRRIESGGEELVGFYHSHPSGPARPSATDAARAYWPDRSYVIVILDGGGTGDDGTDDDGTDDGGPSVGSWRWRDDGFERETVRIDD